MSTVQNLLQSAASMAAKACINKHEIDTKKSIFERANSIFEKIQESCRLSNSKLEAMKAKVKKIKSRFLETASAMQGANRCPRPVSRTHRFQKFSSNKKSGDSSDGDGGDDCSCHHVNYFLACCFTTLRTFSVHAAFVLEVRK